MTLVDSDALIVHFRNSPEATNWLIQARTRGPLAVSVVTVTEITGEMRSAERRAVWRLLTTMRQEPVTGQIARRAGEFMKNYRRSHPGIALGDYLIAATAEVQGLESATLNIRNFPMFSELEAPFAVE